MRERKRKKITKKIKKRGFVKRQTSDILIMLTIILRANSVGENRDRQLERKRGKRR